MGPLPLLWSQVWSPCAPGRTPGKPLASASTQEPPKPRGQLAGAQDLQSQCQATCLGARMPVVRLEGPGSSPGCPPTRLARVHLFPAHLVQSPALNRPRGRWRWGGLGSPCPPTPCS